MTVSMKARGIAAGAAASGSVASLVLIEHVLVRSGPAADAMVVIPAALAIAAAGAVFAAWPASRTRLAQVTGMVAAVFLLAAWLHRPHVAPREAFWILAGEALLLLLLSLTIRWATLRGAVIVGLLSAAAGTLTVLQATAPDSRMEALGVVCTWAFVAAGPVGLGVYLRSLDARRARMVLEARRAQRLELAHDLHDFIAHDVTGMVVQAQAARVVAHLHPEEAIVALQGIEEAGLHALGSLDRTVHTLRDTTSRGVQPPPTPVESLHDTSSHQLFGVEDIFSLLGRFSSVDGLPLRLQVDRISELRLAAETSSTAYRLVQEALTNVRRHAPNSQLVEVGITRRTDAVGEVMVVSVANTVAASGGAARGPLREDSAHQGLGLVGLAERVDAIGGEFAAGPLPGMPTPGWRVTAVLPLLQRERR